MASLKTHSFKITVYLKDLLRWKNEGSLYAFNVQFILIRFLGRLLNLQPGEKTSNSDWNGTFVIALILIPVKSLTFLLQKGNTGENILRNRKSYTSPKGPATLRLHAAHPFISLALIQTLEMYRGTKLKSCQTPSIQTQSCCPRSTSCNWTEKRHCCCTIRCNPSVYPSGQGLHYPMDPSELLNFKHKGA